MSKRYRVSVCKGTTCRRGGSDAVFVTARERVLQAGLSARCELYRGGCYGLCHLGPNVVVRDDNGKKRDPLSPENYQLTAKDGEAYYWAMTPERMGRVLESHVGADHPVDELFGDPSREPEAAEARAVPGGEGKR